MKIIVVGCGKLGKAVIASLVDDGHDVTAIDWDETVIQSVGDRYDVMTVCGNGVDYVTLEEASVEGTDLLVAMTPSDETNMLCCFLGRSMGASHTVARIESTRTTDRELEFIKQKMNISMFIRPSRFMAAEIINMLRQPEGIRAEYFARRSFELVEVTLDEKSPFVGLPLSQVKKKIKGEYLICTVLRGEEAFVPGAGFVFEAGDRITINATPKEANRVLRELGFLTSRSRSVMIVGGSRTAVNLAGQLLDEGASVKIIEQNRNRCRSICEQLPKAIVINGDGSMGELLNEEGLKEQDAFVSLTGMDEQNILLAIYARRRKVKKVVAKVDRDEFYELSRSLGLEGQVDPKGLVSQTVLRYARALNNTSDSGMETLYRLLNGRVEAAEFVVKDGFKSLGIPFVQLHRAPNVLIGGLVRGSRRIIPGPDTSIEVGDRVVVISLAPGVRDLSEAFEE